MLGNWFMMYNFNYFLFILPGLIVGIWAQMKMKATFAKYEKVQTLEGITGAQAARRILDNSGLQNVAVERVSGRLSDHYDPRTNVVRLSDATYNSATVGAVGVAAHECGHALQHAQGYVPIKIRSSILPLCSMGSGVSVPLIFLGFILTMPSLVTLGIVLFSLVVLFQLVTLPVEFNASRRAMAILGSSNMVTPEEGEGVRKVLTAAALTYVAALLTSVLQLLYYITLAGGRRRN